MSDDAAGDAPVGDTAFDTTRFKDAMSRFTTGVTIVAGIDGDEPVGFTCQSFVSLSLDPPYVAVAPARTSTSWPRIARSGSFCVNVLHEDQEALCRGFAVSGGHGQLPLSSKDAPSLAADTSTLPSVAATLRAARSMVSICRSVCPGSWWNMSRRLAPDRVATSTA